MSGGSLNYLFCKETEQLFAEERVAELEAARDVLVKAGYIDIAKDVQRLAEYIQCAQIRVGVLHEQLQDVLHAVEWYMSADYGKTTMCKHLDAYRTGRTAGEARP
jgi:hypothetical protein